MDLTEEQRSALLRDLDLRLRNETEFDHVFADRPPDWYGKLLSSIILVTGDAHVLYLSASHVIEGTAFSAVVALFTQKLCVQGTVTGDVGLGDADPVVHAVSRNSLTSLHVSSDHIAFGPEPSEHWPGSIRLTLRFKGDLAVSLPLGGSRGDEWASELQSLVETSRSTLER